MFLKIFRQFWSGLTKWSRRIRIVGGFLYNFELKFSLPNPPFSMRCFDATMLVVVPVVILPMLLLGLESRLMYSLQVLFPKIDWIDRMIIAFKQHKNARRRRWRASFFLCWGGFHLSSMWLICQHEKRHICLDMPNRRVSIAGVFYQPLFWSGSSPRHFNGKHRPVLGLASHDVDDACFWNGRLEFTENAKGQKPCRSINIYPD